jgi:hypothetical protein
VLPVPSTLETIHVPPVDSRVKLAVVLDGIIVKSDVIVGVFTDENVGDPVVPRFCVIECVNVDPLKDVLHPLELAIAVSCNNPADDALTIADANAESVIFANVGAPVVAKFCVIVCVKVDPLNDVLHPFALAIVTDCN